MYQFTPYLPAFVVLSDPVETLVFESEEALLASKIPQRFVGADFSGFEFSDDLLMATYNEGREWWVVGFVHPPMTSIPKWKPKR